MTPINTLFAFCNEDRAVRCDGLGQFRQAIGDALNIAKQSTPATPLRADPAEPNKLAPGARVSVTPDDYGFDPVSGELVASSVHEIAIRRIDPEVGEIVVHFPRIGFRVSS